MAVELEPEASTHESKKRIRGQNTPQRRSNQSLLYKYGAKNVIRLFVPISICALAVVFLINNISFLTATPSDSLYSSLFAENSTDSSVIIFHAIVNTLITIGVTILSTTIIVLLYIYKFYKVIIVWFLVTALFILFGLTIVVFEEILISFNVPMDIFSTIMFHWNFGVTGMISIFWKGPRRCQQGYSIFMSARTAVMFIRFLPEWTTWMLLIGISVWDVIAVLTPRGPLKKFIDTVTKREEPVLPMLIYFTYVFMATETFFRNEMEDVSVEISPTPPTVEVEYGGESGETNQQRHDIQPADTKSTPREYRKRKPRKRQFNKEREGGFRLGLGDFVFYSVLVGKASLFGNYFTTLTCLIAVLIGLCFTLFLLVRFKKALPALPISIIIGMVFYFFSHYFVVPFEESLSLKQIFI